MNLNEAKIAVIGLGYVGLPLAVEFGAKFSTVGFDINENRIQQLKLFNDSTLEVSNEKLAKVLTNGNLVFSNNLDDLINSNVYVVTVPTPTDINNRPLLQPLINASETVGSVLKRGDFVIYESTVYPGVTEEECVPILEAVSGLKFNIDFFVGYSPERINPGDKTHTLTKILKITSGSTPEAATFIDNLYQSIIEAGTFKASSIKVAEAAKVIENTQRDINIAFINELSKIFNLLEIDTFEILEAAATKWNFLNFKPGLVGGHCIGVDPYYLAQKAQEVGYHPEIILAGRRLNDNMAKYVANRVIKLMIGKDIKIKQSNILVMGFTFKENCPDYRNTKVIDIIRELESYEINVDVIDPYVNVKEVNKSFNISISSSINDKLKYDAIILAVAHEEFIKVDLKKYCSDNRVIFDVKGVLDLNSIDARL